MKKFKLKISTYNNENIIKCSAEKLEDFDPIMKTIKKKYGEDKKR